MNFIRNIGIRLKGNYDEIKQNGSDEMDREKVIKVVGEMFDMYKSEYEGTSYFDETEWAENKRDALALLKEQKAVKPKKVKGYNPPMYTLYEYECEECKSPMMNKQPFCMGCGKPVKWE